MDADSGINHERQENLDTDYTNFHEFFNRQDAREAEKTGRQNLARRTRRQRGFKAKLSLRPPSRPSRDTGIFNEGINRQDAKNPEKTGDQDSGINHVKHEKPAAAKKYKESLTRITRISTNFLNRQDAKDAEKTGRQNLARRTRRQRGFKAKLSLRPSSRPSRDTGIFNEGINRQDAKNAEKTGDRDSGINHVKHERPAAAKKYKESLTRITRISTNLFNAKTQRENLTTDGRRSRKAGWIQRAPTTFQNLAALRACPFRGTGTFCDFRWGERPREPARQ